jgi:tRNA A37 N6-isopentenylltransferase MiaA
MSSEVSMGCIALVREGADMVPNKAVVFWRRSSAAECHHSALPLADPSPLRFNSTCRSCSSTASPAFALSAAMLASAPLPPPPPIEARVIFIVGATGCGKSRLSVDLALALAAAHSASAAGHDGDTHQCEIVSADSKQVFRGLDIGSAKTTLAEQRGVRHHLTDCLAPHAPFSVAEFRRAAAAAIADVCARGRTPIVVGGTFYYVESLLFPAHAIRTDGEASASSSSGSISSAEQREVATAPARLAHSASLTSSDPNQTFHHDAVTIFSEHQSTIPAPATSAIHAPTIDAYARLCEVDPVMARKLHPNDTRKIARALQGTVRAPRMIWFPPLPISTLSAALSSQSL